MDSMWLYVTRKESDMKKRMFAGIVVFVTVFLFCAIVSNGKDEDTYIKQEYQEYCNEIGEMYCICPELLMAMIEAESSGVADAKNGSCKGLMQVSERWHKDRMKRLGVEDIFDPYGNILVAADYLLELFERYHDVGVVLMVYNGDSRADEFADGECDLSKYAQKILDRSAELERLHGK